MTVGELKLLSAGVLGRGLALWRGIQAYRAERQRQAKNAAAEKQRQAPPGPIAPLCELCKQQPAQLNCGVCTRCAIELLKVRETSSLNNADPPRLRRVTPAYPAVVAGPGAPTAPPPASPQAGPSSSLDGLSDLLAPDLTRSREEGA